MIVSHIINVQAAADKIVREMEMFGPDFERFEEVQAELARIEAEKEKAEEEAATAATAAGLVDKTKAKKGKLVAKSTGLTYQFQIMESINIPRTEIKKFADPQHWLKYFPPIAIVRRLWYSYKVFLNPIPNASLFSSKTTTRLDRVSTGAEPS